MTAKELFGKHFNGLHYDDITPERIEKYAIEFAEFHVKKALKAASKKSKIKEGQITDYKLTNSILIAYKLDLIK